MKWNAIPPDDCRKLRSIVYQGSWSVCVVMFCVCFFHVPKNSFPQDTIPQKVPTYLAISGGIYSCLDLWASTGFVNLQVVPGKKIWVLRPQAGALVSFLGSCMIYAGMVYPAMPAKWLNIQTGAAVGYYESGNGIRLGFPVEFRLSLSVLYCFRNRAQLGLEIAHISNGGLSDPNPGTESFSVIFQFPVRPGGEK